LALQSTVISDAGISHVAELTELQELSIWVADITDAGVARLSRLKHLQSLELFASKITERSLPAISQLKGLRRLDFRAPRISEPLAAELKKALLDCEILLSEPSPIW
jgi:hypothetical protein